MGNLKALTDSNEYEVTSNEALGTWSHLLLKSDQDEGDELSVTVTFNDKEKYSDTNGVVDLNLPKVTETNGEFLYTFPSDLIESFGGATPTPILQFDSQYDNIPWLTTTAKFFVANDSKTIILHYSWKILHLILISTLSKIIYLAKIVIQVFMFIS